MTESDQVQLVVHEAEPEEVDNDFDDNNDNFAVPMGDIDD